MAWPQDAYVGQKVVCVDISGGVWGPTETLMLNEEYTISAIGPDNAGTIVFQLLELRRDAVSIAVYGPAAGYFPWRFRPVQTKATETGMAILRKLQDPTNHKVLEGGIMADDDTLAAFSQKLRELERVMELECVPPELKAAGWEYRDMPGRMTPEARDYLFSLIGEGNYKVLISSQGNGVNGPWWRGQLVISPQGFQNLRDHKAKNTGVSRP